MQSTGVPGHGALALDAPRSREHKLMHTVGRSGSGTFGQRTRIFYPSELKKKLAERDILDRVGAIGARRVRHWTSFTLLQHAPGATGVSGVVSLRNGVSSQLGGDSNPAQMFALDQGHAVACSTKPRRTGLMGHLGAGTHVGSLPRPTRPWHQFRFPVCCRKPTVWTALVFARPVPRLCQPWSRMRDLIKVVTAAAPIAPLDCCRKPTVGTALLFERGRSRRC
jgi:hypothetical protein